MNSHSSCLSLLRAEIIRMHHYAWLEIWVLWPPTAAFKRSGSGWGTDNFQVQLQLHPLASLLDFKRRNCWYPSTCCSWLFSNFGRDEAEISGNLETSTLNKPFKQLCTAFHPKSQPALRAVTVWDTAPSGTMMEGSCCETHSLNSVIFFWFFLAMVALC